MTCDTMDVICCECILHFQMYGENRKTFEAQTDRRILNWTIVLIHDASCQAALRSYDTCAYQEDVVSQQGADA